MVKPKFCVKKLVKLSFWLELAMIKEIITQMSKMMPPTLPEWKNFLKIDRLIFFAMAKNTKNNDF